MAVAHNAQSSVSTTGQSAGALAGHEEAAEEDSAVTTRTRIILEAIDKLDRKLTNLQDVSQAVREIQDFLGVNKHWRTAIIRAVKQWLSHVDPNWKK